MRAISPRRSERWRRGATVKLTVLHNGAEKTVTLTLGELPNTKEARANAGRTATAAPTSASSG